MGGRMAVQERVRVMEAVVKSETVNERVAVGRRFELSVTGSDRASLVRVTGPVDLQHAEQLLEEVRPLCLAPRVVVLDLRNADYVDSSGVRALMELDQAAGADNGELRLVVRPESRVARVLTLLRLMDRLHVYTSTSEAWETGSERLQSVA